MRVGINGFGRIGRILLRIAEKNPHIEIVAINSRGDALSHAHLIKYDSTYGVFDADIEAKDNELFVNGRKIHAFQQKNPKDIPWNKANVDIVVEATGKFKDPISCQAHIDAGAKRVVIAAPGKDVPTFVMGVNEEKFDPSKDTIISNASCTTNCLAPVAKVLHENFGIKNGIMTTIHAFTNDQNTLDNSHKDLRRARTATASMIPTSTGAAKAVSLVLPELEGKLTGLAIRVPTQTVSLVDLTVHLEKAVDIDTINQIFKNNASNYLGVSDLPLVSIDYKANTHSSVVDLLSTQVIGGNLVKVLAWYDNEWGYTCRLIDLIRYVGKHI